MVSISGLCNREFARVRDEFERNFTERGDIGASVCVTLDGEPVVDLWGGIADPDASAPWVMDTICMVWSCTKAATALCVHILAERGLLDLNAPVIQYWPEFGRKGKEKVTIKMLMNHQAGLPMIRRLKPHGVLYDWQAMVRLLEEEELYWEPGTRVGYHPYTYGWLLGEMVRRVTGKSLGAFFRTEVAEPLGLDFAIGLPERDEPRVAPNLPPDLVAPTADVLAADWFRKTTAPGSLYMMLDAWVTEVQSEVDSRAFHAAEMPGLNGITNARGLAGMYAPLACGGDLKGIRLVNGDTLARMSAVSSACEQDAMGALPVRYALGFYKTNDTRHIPGAADSTLILSEEAFGHGGMGGSLGFADPKARMSFGYVMNKRGATPRSQRLVDATYLSLGFTSCRSGAWR